MNGQRCDIYVYNGALVNHKNEGNPAICSSMDHSWGHFVKWGESSRGRLTIYDVIYVWNLKKKKINKVIEIKG